MKKILIFSSCEYSLNNKGDQAMIEGLVSWLQANNTNPEIITYEMTPGALSPINGVRPFPSPEQFLLGISGQCQGSTFQTLIARIKTILRGFYLILRFFIYRLIGTRFQNETYLHGFFHQILSADVLFFSGGGYLNSVWWADGLYSKTFPALVAHLAGVPIILTSQGLGPFKHPLDRFVAWILFTCCSVIGVRDGELSIMTVNDISSRSTPRTLTTGDDALLVQVATASDIAKILQAEGVPKSAEHLIAINLRDSSSYEQGYSVPPFASVAAALDKFLEQSGWHVVFVPISYHITDGDRESAKKIQELMRHSERVTIINNEYSPSILKGIVANSKIAIGTSYHFLLFALSQNIPVLALYQDPYYQQKLTGLTKLYRLNEFCLCMKYLDENKIFEHIHNLLEQSESISDNLSKTNIDLQAEFNDAHNVMLKLISDR